MISPKRWAGLSFVLVLVGLPVSSGCQQPAASQQPASPAGLSLAEGGGSVAFLRWKDGPAVMICSDIQGGTSSSRDSVSGPPWVRKVEGSASSKDGRRFDWQLETTDGRSVRGRVDGKEYDLAKGALFLVKTKGGKTEVEQRRRDLSAVQPELESCRAFVRKDPAVSKLLGTGGD
jgi:hypothetical protein